MRLENDFHHNKKVCSDVAIIHSKRIRNRVAGYVTRLMKRISKGHVKGINIKEHEKERETRENFIPEVSLLDSESFCVDKTTLRMIREYDYKGNFYNPDAESSDDE
ncbi:40S ribosomal protein S17 [Astathelohania contejeani]|uniref:40S ribosomal protein S17 n=1 Tax=Astathelohania contejeani TaxID=164912 RepID=A0ABQ7HZ28_9MICR|nr:40S ribosomal protein S17 [Thelohania contejeani]